MLSKKTRYSYEILEDGERMPFKIQRGPTEKALKQIQEGLSKVNTAIKDLYGTDAYWFVMRHILPYNLSEDEGKIYSLKEMEESVTNLRESLETKDDEIPSYEEVVTLSDLGYKKDICSHYDKFQRWEKVLKNETILKNEMEEEIVEEIILFDNGETIRRIRTILWDVMPGGRSSKSITYRRKPMSKKLQKACESTRRNSDNA